MFGRYDRWMYVHANICSFALKFRPDNGTKAVMGSPWFITIYPEGWYDCMCHISWRELKGFSDIIYRKPKWKHHGGIKIKTLVWLAVGARRKVRGYSVFRIHPLGTVNMWPQIHCNQSNNCWDFSVWIKEVNQTTDWYSHLWIHVASIPSNDLLGAKFFISLFGRHFFLSLCECIWIMISS